MSSQFRVYFGPDDQEDVLVPTPKTKPESVKIKLGEVVSILRDAHDRDRIWLNDFADEDICVSADLHEVLLTYERYRKSPA